MLEEWCWVLKNEFLNLSYELWAKHRLIQDLGWWFLWVNPHLDPIVIQTYLKLELPCFKRVVSTIEIWFHVLSYRVRMLILYKSIHDLSGESQGQTMF